MVTLHFFLLILALVCFFAATLKIESPRLSFLPLGLLLWCLATVIAR